MRPAHPIETSVGMEWYVTESNGCGGRLRQSPGDFRVTELEQFEVEPLDADPGSYQHVVFRATLETWDTNDFARTLSNRLGISRERISWAGTKDKHAVTTQLFSVDGIDPATMPEVNDATIEVIGRAGRPVLFGDLAGNAFEVTVRETDDPAAADAVTTELRSFAGATDVAGVPNYFGHQRFGSRRPVTHEVGLAIVREDFEAAVMAYLGNPSEREPTDTQEARAYVDETRDWQGALERFPNHLRYERSMLHRLTDGGDEPTDFRAALEELPSNLQQLFVHAAQSYIFNLTLSERLDRGLPFDRPVEGDVVCFSDADAPDDLALPDTDRTQAVTGARVDSVTRHCERGRAFVTAPLVGTETTFAEGEPGEITHEVLEAVGVERADFDLPGEFHSEGTRRAILVRTPLTLEHDPLTVSFALPRGSYATVVLREYLKADPAQL